MTIRIKIKHDEPNSSKNIRISGPAMMDTILLPGEEGEFHIWKEADLRVTEE